MLLLHCLDLLYWFVVWLVLFVCLVGFVYMLVVGLDWVWCCVVDLLILVLLVLVCLSCCEVFTVGLLVCCYLRLLFLYYYDVLGVFV